MLIFAFDEPWLGSPQSVGVSPILKASAGESRPDQFSDIQSWRDAGRASRARKEKPALLSPKIKVCGFNPSEVGTANAVVALGSSAIGAMRDAGTRADEDMHFNGGMGDGVGRFIAGARCMDVATRLQPFDVQKCASVAHRCLLCCTGPVSDTQDHQKSRNDETETVNSESLAQAKSLSAESLVENSKLAQMRQALLDHAEGKLRKALIAFAYHGFHPCTLLLRSVYDWSLAFFNRSWTVRDLYVADQCEASDNEAGLGLQLTGPSIILQASDEAVTLHLHKLPEKELPSLQHKSCSALSLSGNYGIKVGRNHFVCFTICMGLRAAISRCPAPPRVASVVFEKKECPA